MVFSAKTSYGLVSLLELAAIFRKGGVLQGGEIAQRQGIPDRYLEQMLASLRRACIVRSSRGPKGGYQLARPPAEIRVSEVVQALEGVGSTKSLRGGNTPEHAVLLSLEQRLETARRDILESATLQDLLEERDQLADVEAMYFI